MAVWLFVFTADPITTGDPIALHTHLPCHGDYLLPRELSPKKRWSTKWLSNCWLACPGWLCRLSEGRAMVRLILDGSSPGLMQSRKSEMCSEF